MHFTIHQITKKTVALWVFLATVYALAGGEKGYEKIRAFCRAS
jgi:hypothetical protein